MRGRSIPTRVAIALLAVHALLGLWHAWSTSATYDETTHIASGYLTWRTGDFRLNPEHPPLVKLWATLPLLALDPWPSSAALTHPDSAAPPPSDRRLLQDAWHHAATDFLQQWTVAAMLLYGKTDAVTSAAGMDSRFIPPTRALSRSEFLNDADQVVRLARVPIIAVSVTLGWLLFCWTRALFGASGALVAVMLYALDPNLIAHGSLVTTDLPLACFLFASLFAWWRALGTLSPRHLVAAVAWPVLAVTTKLTAILLAPVLVVCGVVRILSPAPWTVPERWERLAGTRRGRAVLVGLLTGATALAAFVGIWGIYGFRFSMARPTTGVVTEAPPLRTALLVTARTKQLIDSIPSGDFPMIWGQEIPPGMPLDPGGRILEALNRHRVLPEAFLFGTAIARLYGLRRVAFLDGEISPVGFRRYFAVAAALKTPLLTLFLILLGALSWVRAPGRTAQSSAAFLAPISAYTWMIFASPLNIGYRHLLPLLPLCLVLTGSLPHFAPTARSKRVRSLRVGLAGLTLVVGTQIVWTQGRPRPIAPNFLAYFNALAGGPDGGRHHLVDSNLDWGQDLPALGQWLRSHRAGQPINLCYFGTADPQWYGIQYRAMPGCDHFRLPGAAFRRGRPGLPETIAPLEPSGWLVISATQLSGTYFSVDDRSRWRDFLATYAVPVDTIGHSLFVYRIRRGAY